MYKLGTTLIFTSLTQASAAADLFGRHNLEVSVFESGAIRGVYRWQSAKFSLMPEGRETLWRIVLDTEEKVQWFVPQDCDVVENIKGRVGKFISVLNQYSIKRIIERNGKPFPQPQEVKTEESL